MLRPLTAAMLIAMAPALSAQTMGLTQYDPAYGDGYLLFAPMSSTTTYLIDRCGNEVDQWTSVYAPGTLAQLQPDGTLLRAANTLDPRYAAGGRGGALERFDWSGNLLWSCDLSNDSLCQHHDFTTLPNGNILVTVWDRRDSADAVLHGKNPFFANAEIWSERILELQPIGTDSAAVVWEWKLWDHLVQDLDTALTGYGVVADHPERVDINFFQGPAINVDWIHLNSIAYNADLDQVMVSSHNLDELWIIDHSTTTAEAAGHTGGNSGRGGDLLYRWGNPRSYDRGGTVDQRFFGQHHATWLAAGHAFEGSILVFNNGLGRPGNDYSSVDIVTPPVDLNGNYTLLSAQAFGPAAAAWTWTMPTPTDLFAQNISGVHPVADGFLVTDGPRGRVFQLDAQGALQWTYINPVNQNGPMMQGALAQGNTVFRYEFYPADFDGFTGVSLAPGDPIELNPVPLAACLATGLNEVGEEGLTLFPNPSSDRVTVQLEGQGAIAVSVFDATGRLRARAPLSSTGRATLELSGLTQAIYTIEVNDGSGHRIAASRLAKVD